MRPHRFLTTLIGAGLLWSAEAPGLGLGDIELKSHLNQPLSAEIALLAVNPGEIDQITIRLADQAAHAAAGVERMDILSDLIFTKQVDAKGNVEIAVTSNGTIKEPYLDFVVEVDWPNGKVYRQYTLLLDPPVFTSAESGGVAEPQVGFSIHGDQAADQADMGMQSRESQTVARDKKPSTSSAGASASSTAPKATSSASDDSSRVEDGEIKVKRSETLWGVAQSIYPDKGYSVEQRMAGLYEANPNAFGGGNINNLKAGIVMRLPSEEEIAKHSRNDAMKLAKKHYQEWLESRRLAASAAGKTESGGAMPAPMAEGGASATGTTHTAQARLSVVSPEEKKGKNGAGTKGSQGGVSDSDMALVMEKAKQENADDSALKARIASLEEQLAMMERLITLKDDALVEMQRQLGGDQAKVSLPDDGQAKQGAAAVEPDANIAETVAPPVESTNTAKSVEGAATLDQKKAPAQSQPAKPVAKVTPKPTPIKEEESSSILDLLLDPQLLMIGVGGLVIIAAGIVVIRKRKMRNEIEEDDSAPDFDQLNMDLQNAGKDGAGGSEFDESEFAELTSESLSSISDVGNFSGGAGMDALQTDETDIDPIAEADVYLAYRRFQQAEDIIKEAMQRHPDRQDLQGKLLEIYFTSGNKIGFESQAEALFASLGGQASNVWNDVVRMGRELCPSHPLFGGDGLSDAVSTAPAAGGSALDLAEIDDFDASAFENLDSLGDTQKATDTLDDLDFSSFNFEEPSESVADVGIDDFSDLDAQVGGSSNEKKNNNDSLSDFDGLPLDDFSSTVTSNEVSAQESADEFDFSEKLSFDEIAEQPQVLESAHEPVEEFNALSFDENFAVISDAEDESAKAEHQDAVPEKTEELAIGALSFEALGTDQDISDKKVGKPLHSLAGAGSESSKASDSLDDFAFAEKSVDTKIAERSDALDGLMSSSSQDGDNITQELSYNYGEMEEVFTGLADSELKNNGDDDMFGSADMIGTKLDLARAYIDMEDLEGARGILQEVLEEGSDAQKQEAKEMMQKIG